MKYGIREICDVVLRAKSRMKVGNKVFYKDEPVIYFDSLKTSTMEGAATTVYAQGGRGNSRLVAWEGERTVTFTMEDALISKLGLAILTGADVIDATKEKPMLVHVHEVIAGEKTGNTTKFELSEAPAENTTVYAMEVDSKGDPISEPYLCKPSQTLEISNAEGYTAALPTTAERFLVDYYVNRSNGSMIEITPDKFGGNFYLEASTLFRNTDGVDLPAEFIIPNCKVQSNFTFTMASSGDPSTFTFTMDAFPDYTKANPNKKVLSAIQIIEDSVADDFTRRTTPVFPNGAPEKPDASDTYWESGESNSANDDKAGADA